jgi:hypothetical protein
VQILKRAVVNDPLQAIAVQFIRAGYACRSGARQDVFRLDIVDTPGRIPRSTGLPFPADAPRRDAFAIASPVFLIDAKGKLNTGLVHAEAI